MPKLGHTPYTYKQIVELSITSFTTNIVYKINCMDPSNPKMAQLFMNMPHKALTLLWAKHNLHLSICPHP